MLLEVFWTCVLVLQGVFYASSYVVPVKEGDSVTLHNDFQITNQDKIRWFFKDTLIADIDLFNGKSCTDVRCNEGTKGFRDRLKLDHQTGNLTIMNTRITDSGQYILEVIRIGSDQERIFNLTVLRVADKLEMGKDQEGESDTSDPGQSAGAVAGICVTLVLPLVIGFGVICFRRCQARSGNRPHGCNEQVSEVV